MTNNADYDVEQGIRRVLAISGDSHDAFTPFALCDEIIDKIPSLTGNILVIANLEFVYVLLRRGVPGARISFATPNDSKARVAVALGIARVYKYNNVITKEDVDGMKFDVVVGNPPYKRNLHLDFLKISHELLTDNGVGIIIHPGSWVLNEVPGLDKIKDAREWANKYVTEFEFRPFDSCFEEIVLGVPVVMTMFQARENNGKINVLDKAATDTEYEVASIEAITKHGNNSIYQGLKKKILGRISTSSSFREHLNTGGKYYVTMSTLIGGGNFKTNAPFFSFTYKKNAYVRTELESKHTRYFGFQTKEEAENFLTYIKSYFARFCLSIAKFDRSLNPITLSSTPWMDFSKKWTDVELFEHFQLTKEEIEFIYKNIPSFYEDVPKINDPK